MAEATLLGEWAAFAQASTACRTAAAGALPALTPAMLDELLLVCTFVGTKVAAAEDEDEAREEHGALLRGLATKLHAAARVSRALGRCAARGFAPFWGPALCTS